MLECPSNSQDGKPTCNEKRNLVKATKIANLKLLKSQKTARLFLQAVNQVYYLFNYVQTSQ